jgi:hypothetical protein
VGVEFMIKSYLERNIITVATHKACFHHDFVIISAGVLQIKNSFKKPDAPKHNF